MGSAQDRELAELLDRAAAMDRQAHDRWDIVREIQRRTDRAAFEAARARACSAASAERVLGLDILAQIGYPGNYPFLEETLPVLVAACDDPRPEVLDSAITGLGHVKDARGLAAVLRHAAHPDSDVRFAVAFALPGVAGDPPAETAASALIQLSSDPEPDIRDWATFGLGTLLEDADSASIRDALAARLLDPGGDTSGEALLGLALRHDPRALPVLLSRLEDNPGNLVVEAAAALGFPAALPALRRLKAEGWQRDALRPDVLDEALRACSG